MKISSCKSGQAPQAPEGGRQRRYRDVVRQPDPHRAGHRALAQARRHRVAQRQDAAGVAQEQLALGGRHHAASGAVQQALAGQALEAPDLGAQRRLRASGLVGGAAQAAMPAHRDESAQQLGFESVGYHVGIMSESIASV
jgi:hypothetical protein